MDSSSSSSSYCDPPSLFDSSTGSTFQFFQTVLDAYQDTGSSTDTRRYVCCADSEVKNCPNKKEQNVDKKLCYNCGEFGHSLPLCPRPLEDGGTKYATCFICKEQGHLSKDCPKNAHGIYPKGGCCKICSGVTHLAKDCPNKGFRGSDISNEAGKRPSRIESIARGQVTKFASGDDLEDDFTTIDDTW